MQGLPIDNKNLIPLSGITPACSEDTKQSQLELESQKDHPCMFGGYEWDGKERIRTLGSPSHVRGLRRPAGPISMRSRITPACAGTAVVSLFWLSSFWDHPCMCGDYSVSSAKSNLVMGSPPPVRGPLCGEVSQLFL